MARSLGLDVGNRRVGVAVSDTLKLIARPVEIVDRRMVDVFQRIVAIVQEQQVDEIVIGYPWNTNGTAGTQAQSVERFTETLRQRISVPLIYSDERYSTGEAREIIGAKKRKDQSDLDDAIAAAVILQRYLDARREQISMDESFDDGYLTSD